MRVLLIDDSAAYREEFAELLAEGEFAHAELDYAANAAEGSRLLNLGEHSIYFVDYRLPGDNGVELIKRARQAGVMLPILCLTSYDDPKTDQAAEHAGASGYLSKEGVSAKGLARTIRYALRNAARPPVSPETADRFERAQAAARIGTWEIDIPANRLTWSNQTFRIHGIDPPDEPGIEDSFDFYAPEAKDVIRAAVALAKEIGEGFDLELPLIRADGRRIWVRSIASVGFANDKPVLVSGTFQDITARVEERRALQRANERITLAVNCGRIGIWDWDILNKEFIWDLCMFRLYGMEPSDQAVPYDSWTKHLHREDLAYVEGALQDAVVGKRAFDLEFRVIWDDGSVHYIHSTGEVSRNAKGTALRMAGTNWDITESREQAAELARQVELVAAARDDALRANRAKSRFLAGMSHELRTPLNGILGYAQLLRRDGDLNPTQAGRIQAMLNAGNHLLEMITCVLDLSEIEAEHVKVQRVGFDIKAVGSACLELVRPSAEIKGLGLQMTCAADAPATVFADPTRLRQVLLNLLGNATKFTSAGQIDLRLLPMPHGAGLRVEVDDTGPGIPADQRGRLFQDFDRLDGEKTKGIEGAGLGLALSARLMSLIGGSLGHEDKPSGGSIFWLELPQRANDETARTLTQCKPEMSPSPSFDQQTEAPLGTIKPCRNARILVVDDVDMNRDIACAFLISAGHEAKAAESGAQAIEMLAFSDFDLVLMDVQMPGMNGLEAARRIRALPGSASRVPIIALTAQVFADQIEECQRAGMEHYLAKPIVYKSLLNAVEVALKASEKKTEAPQDASKHEMENARPRLANAGLLPEQLWDREPAPAPQPDLPVVDHQVLDSLQGVLSREQLLKLLSAVRENINTGLTAAPSTPSERRALELRMHNLFSKAGTFGLAQLSASCRTLEFALKTDEAVKTSIESVTSAMERAGLALEAIIKETQLGSNTADQLSLGTHKEM